MQENLNGKTILALSSGILAGVGTTLSLVGVPSILATSDPLPVWKKCYNNGKNIALSANAVCTISGVWLYYQKEDPIYLVASGLAAAVVPWTLLAMLPTNNALHAIKDGDRQGQDRQVRQLVEKWSKLQWVRTGLGLGAFLAAIVAIQK